MVAGIHCRGEDLAFFPPRRIFSTTNVYIRSENAAHIGGFYFMRLTTFERRVPDFIVLFIFTSVGECKVKEPTILTEVRIEVLRANVCKNRATGGHGQKLNFAISCPYILISK